jgi:hypothetical protein
MYELQTVESFLREKNKPNPDVLLKEQKRIEQEFLKYLYNDRSSDKLEIYVRQHAQSLINIISTETNQEKPEIVDVAENLLIFLERHGEPYWDYHLAVPNFYKEPVINFIKTSLPVIQSKLDKLNIEPPFEPLFTKEVLDLVNRTVVEYGQIYMLKAIITALLELPDLQENDNEVLKEDGRRLLREIICRYNFNSLLIYGYAADRIKKEEEEKDKEDVIFRLMRMQQFYDGVKVEKNLFYQPHRLAFTEMMSDYIQDRIELKHRELIPPDKSITPVGPDSQKVHTNLTMEKLGFFLRLFIDTEVFRINNWKGLTRFMSVYVTTIGKSDKPEKESVSDGLYTNMYSPNLKTIVGVIDIIERMHKRAIVWKNSVKNTGKPPAKVID